MQALTTGGYTAGLCHGVKQLEVFLAHASQDATKGTRPHEEWMKNSLGISFMDANA